MQELLEQRHTKLQSAAHLKAALDWIAARAEYKVAKVQQLRDDEVFRLNEAASRINAGVRGYFARQRAKDIRATIHAAIQVQKTIRGFLGRRKAKKKLWEKMNLVPGTYALKLLFAKSRMVQTRGNWLEYLDLQTYRFWYYNRANEYTLWDPPEEFKRELVCTWDPCPYPWESDLDPPCRLTFSCVNAYNTHRMTCHSWYCPACDYRNTGLLFPRCEACDNHMSQNGKNMVKELHGKLRRVMKEIAAKEEEAEKEKQEAVAEELRLRAKHDRRKLRARAKGLKECSLAQYYALDDLRARKPEFPVVYGKAYYRADSDPTSPNFLVADDVISVESFKSLSSSDASTDGHVSTLRPLHTSMALSSDMQKKDGTGRSPPPGCMFVCEDFLAKACGLGSTCPLAHPGERDSAEQVKLAGKKKGRCICVKVCHAWLQGECNAGIACTSYHIYIRPSTAELVRKIYTKRKGPGQQRFKSGAVLSGNMVDCTANGYGTMTWPNNDTYMGDWVHGNRNGVGIFRTTDGREYVGEWQDGRRDGLGIWTGSNGEVFEGEWKEGRMHGVGRLASLNGDVYEGQFVKNSYHGLGRFRKLRGDTFTGYCRCGKAEGLGVLILRIGEVYKGHFHMDQRHGKGVCVYPDGSRYAGQWCKGKPSGFGILTDLQGQRYVGQWHNGRKHGYGRQLFENGDVYDGDWKNDMAYGKGFYRYEETGSIFVGGFKDNKKHGKGLYYTLDGSRFEGIFADGHVEGRGSFVFGPQNAKYIGTFKDGKKHGKGVYSWANGNKYVGDFVDDKLSGVGEMRYAVSGHRYVGEWRDNKKNGKGIFYYADGNIYEGEFKDDIKHGRGKLIINPGGPVCPDAPPLPQDVVEL